MPDDRIVEEDYSETRSFVDPKDSSKRSYRHGVLDEVAQWAMAPQTGFAHLRDSAAVDNQTGTIDDEDSQSQAATEVGSISLRGSRVLVADDNSDMRRYVSSVLAAAGYSVFEVADGEAALEAAKRDPPDLVLSDISALHAASKMLRRC